KYHAIFGRAAFRSASQAATTRASSSRVAIRRPRHCRASTENSSSATFSQLACLGVSWNSSRSVSRRASSGANASYNDAGPSVLRLSSTTGITRLRVQGVAQVLHLVGEVDPGAPRGHRHVPEAGQWLDDEEQVGRPLTGVLVILARRVARPSRQRRVDLA